MGVEKRYLAVAVVCLFLLTSLAGCIDDDPEIDDEPERELQLTEPDVFSADKNGEKVWHIEMVITDQVFEGVDEVLWEEMEVVVFSRDGTINSFDIWPLHGSVPLDFGVKYVPHDPDSTTVGEGDRIIIHGVGEEFEGGSVEVIWNSTLVSEMDLPILFEPGINVTFGEPFLDSIIFPGSTSYTYEAEVTDIDPANATLNWWTLQLRIESPTDAFGDFFGPLIEDPGVEGYDGEDGPPEIEFWYIDDPLGGTNGPGTPTAMDEGDSVLITGLSETFEGGIVTLLKGEDPIWTSDPIPEMPEPNMVLELGSPIILTINRNDTAFWNVSIPISDVDPDDRIGWTSIWVNIWNSEGVLRHSRQLFNQDPGDFYDYPWAYWNDVGPQDEVISIGDDFVIKGLNLSFQGGLVEVYRGFDLLDSVRLPTEWPIDRIRISARSIDITNRTVGNEKYWDYYLNITSVYPDSLVIPWDDIMIRVVDPDTKEVFIPLTQPEPFEDDHRTVPTIFYYEEGTPDGVDRLDTIIVSGLNLTFEGKDLEFYLDGEYIGCEMLCEPFDWDPPRLFLSRSSLNQYNVNVTAYWQGYININKITPVWIMYTWADLQIRILNRTGFELVTNSSVVLDPREYDLDDTDGVDIGLYYVDIQYDGKLGAGDTIKFTGLTDAFVGAVVEYYYNGRLLGTSVLPTDFP